MLFSCCLSMLSLSLSLSECCCRKFKSVSHFLGLVMGLQFRHQRSKLYREVAMGEKHLLSITQGMNKVIVLLLLVPPPYSFVSPPYSFTSRHEADRLKLSRQLSGWDLHLPVLQWLQAAHSLFLIRSGLPSLAGNSSQQCHVRPLIS